MACIATAMSNNTTTTKSATEIEVESGNYLKLFIYQAPKKNCDADAAGHNSRIKLTLNDYADWVSKPILLNLLGASSNNEVYGFLAPHIAAICSWNFGPNSK
jgi:hypothetical protein